MKLSEYIISYRTQHRLSQRQFAKICDLSNGYISMLENEVNPKTNEPVQPSIPALRKIAIGMGISLSELFASIDDTLIDLSSVSDSDISFSPDNIQLTEHERKLIISYRSHPEMQPAIDTLLGLTPAAPATKNA